jgi:eukaryotic-like serine/threonine-protein kinase
MRFLIIDEDEEYRRGLRYYLEVEWPDASIHEHHPNTNLRSPTSLQLETFDAVLLGYSNDQNEGLASLRALLDVAGCPPVLVFAEQGDEFLAVDSLKQGAADYFPKDRVRHRRLIDAFSPPAARDGSISQNIEADGYRNLGRIKAHHFVAKLHASELSSVYLAQEEGTQRKLAYKILRHVPDSGGEQLFDRFLQEYEVVAGIDHPNVVRIFDLGIADDHAYIAMEYLSGGTLAQCLTSALSRGEALEFARQTALALAAIHEAGILHRDLKPTNIMLREDRTLSLIDFGLAKQMWLEAAISGTGQIFGTPHYMSPEQGHAAAVDARSDIYSLGCIVFEMLSGKRPFSASTPMGVIYNHSHAPRPSLPGEYADLQPIVDRMLAPDPQDRFQTAAELIPWLADSSPFVTASRG